MIATILLSSLAVMLAAFTNAEYDVSKYCSRVSTGTKLPSLESCQTYYTCQDNDKVIQSNCTGDNVFSKDTQSCVPKADGNCYFDLSDSCQFKDDEFVRSSEGCNMWNYCLNGSIAGYGSCPIGQIFDAFSSSCVYGNCADSKSNKTLEIANLCEIMPDGQYFGDLENCATWHKCQGLKMKNGNCLDKLVYDTQTSMCLENDGNICQRTKNVVIENASGPPSDDCTDVNQVVGDTNICSIYYTCESTSQTPTPTYEWVQKRCNKQFYDVISKQCNDTMLARPYPGCDRCQFTTGNLHWVNAVDSTCSSFLTCKGGRKFDITEGSCKSGSYYNQVFQYCIGDSAIGQYATQNGACQDYSCTDTRECSLSSEGSGSENGGNSTESSTGNDSTTKASSATVSEDTTKDSKTTKITTVTESEVTTKGSVTEGVDTTKSSEPTTKSSDKPSRFMKPKSFFAEAEDEETIASRYYSTYEPKPIVS